jgi:hypothetical protein
VKGHEKSGKMPIVLSNFRLVHNQIGFTEGRGSIGLFILAGMEWGDEGNVENIGFWGVKKIRRKISEIGLRNIFGLGII